MDWPLSLFSLTQLGSIKLEESLLCLQLTGFKAFGLLLISQPGNLNKEHCVTQHIKTNKQTNEKKQQQPFPLISAAAQKM